MAVAVARPLRGSRYHDFYPIVSELSIPSLDSAFQLQEYIALLIREDPHDVQHIVSIPKTLSNEEGRGKDHDSSQQDEDRDDNVDVNCWIYEHLRRLTQDLNHPLITILQQECTRETCPQMKAGEWLYLCVAHGSGPNMEQCCAIDYILHTVDSATALLSSPRAFPSRITIPQTSHRHFSSLARRLGRVFAHAYFQHREAFEQAEAESSLYSRYLALTSMFDLVPADYLNIPMPSEVFSAEQMSGMEIMRPPESEQGHMSERLESPHRTNTMVFAEGFSLPSAEDMEAYAEQDVSEVHVQSQDGYDPLEANAATIALTDSAPFVEPPMEPRADSKQIEPRDSTNETSTHSDAAQSGEETTPASGAITATDEVHEQQLKLSPMQPVKDEHHLSQEPVDSEVKHPSPQLASEDDTEWDVKDPEPRATELTENTESDEPIEKRPHTQDDSSVHDFETSTAVTGGPTTDAAHAPGMTVASDETSQHCSTAQIDRSNDSEPPPQHVTPVESELKGEQITGSDDTKAPAANTDAIHGDEESTEVAPAVSATAATAEQIQHADIDENCSLQPAEPAVALVTNLSE